MEDLVVEANELVKNEVVDEEEESIRDPELEMVSEPVNQYEGSDVEDSVSIELPSNENPPGTEVGVDIPSETLVVVDVTPADTKVDTTIWRLQDGFTWVGIMESTQLVEESSRLALVIAENKSEVTARCYGPGSEHRIGSNGKMNEADQGKKRCSRSRWKRTRKRRSKSMGARKMDSDEGFKQPKEKTEQVDDDNNDVRFVIEEAVLCAAPINPLEIINVSDLDKSREFLYADLRNKSCELKQFRRTKEREKREGTREVVMEKPKCLQLDVRLRCHLHRRKRMRKRTIGMHFGKEYPVVLGITLNGTLHSTRRYKKSTTCLRSGGANCTRLSARVLKGRRTRTDAGKRGRRHQGIVP
uniref:Uncharacterized protein n=2 Tax=Lygus hesperus TaxID=30085 RepID=A0A146KTV2_LYGHE